MKLLVGGAGSRGTFKVIAPRTTEMDVRPVKISSRNLSIINNSSPRGKSCSSGREKIKMMIKMGTEAVMCKIRD